MPDDPLSDIENLKGFYDMGRSCYQMYKGAIDAGATEGEALMILTSYFSSARINFDDTEG